MHDQSDILNLINSTDITFQRVGCDIVLNNIVRHSELFFKHIVSGDNVGKKLIDGAKDRFFFLTRGCSDDVRFDLKKHYTVFDDIAAEHRMFQKAIQSYINKVDNPKEFDDKILSIFKDISINDTSQRQIIIFITGLCNLHCPYCFSGDINRKEMDLSLLKNIILWCLKNDVKVVSLCGGEPLMYSHFDDMLLLFRENGIQTYFASNLTIELSKFRNVDSKVVKKIYAHITKTILDSPGIKDIFIKNVRDALEKNIDVELRVNIYDDNKEAAIWMNLAEELHINKVDVALTFPTNGKNNAFVELDRISEYNATLKDYLTLAKEKNITIRFAKPMPICLLDSSIARQLLKEYPESTYCSIHKNDYTYNITITNDGYFNYCVGLTKNKMPFSPDTGWADVVKFCSEIKKMIDKPLMEKCGNCYLFDTKICQGSCLSYK